MENASSYILWLPSWYPNKLQPYNGDFVQRHAQAAALFFDIEVIHVIKDEAGRVTKNIHAEVTQSGRLRETIIYYYHPKRAIKILNKISSQKKYQKIYKNAIAILFAERSKPLLTNVHVALNAGLIAQWIERKYGINYVVSEHSTIYLEEAVPNIKSSPVFKALAKRIFSQSKQVMVVSDCLGKALQKNFDVREPVVIPNVVNENVFHYVEKPPSEKAVFIHISTLEYQKNPEQILQAFSMVKEKGLFFELHIVGPEKPDLIKLAQSLNIHSLVQFHAEMPQTRLAELIKSSDALVLFSRFETFGCVVIEAQACGVPVILSYIPVFYENATEENALFAENENASSLAEKITGFIQNRTRFNRKKISEGALQRYSYKTVGQQFKKWYDHLLQKQ